MSSVEYRTFCRDWRDYQRLTQDCNSATVTHIRLMCDAQLRQAIDTIHGDKWQSYSVDQALQEIGNITKHSSNPAVARKRFHALAQTPTEPIREFVVRCKQTAADCRFTCPSCNSDLTDWMLTDQITCGVQSEALQQELLLKHSSFSSFEALRSYSPDYPFQQVVADMFELNGNMYLSYADRLTGWLEVHHFRSAVTSEALCGVFRQLFHRWGAPQELSSDGGPNLSGRPFQLFLRRWGVRWRLSSAHFPQSNGRAEAAVKTAKRIIREHTGRGGHVNTDEAAQALLMYRNTPLRDGGRSPAQLALGRHLRDSIPSPSQRYKLSPEWCRDLRRRELSMVTRGEKSKAAYECTRLWWNQQMGDHNAVFIHLATQEPTGFNTLDGITFSLKQKLIFKISRDE
ncbi:uncharacterized protein FJT64_008407 [Amphibalanus amphitrite]|uniref:Integrase catalytic domain-containing protein n=1 Tax=Amphibalanus amphitrite TaxID=1232801 RepID=A0A6A4VHD7_AMPAM|nr:uncharacterized protein FJT64_008407 [Amphibalanus amphitrite]